MTTSMLSRVALEDRQIWCAACSDDFALQPETDAEPSAEQITAVGHAGSTPSVAAENSVRVLPWHSIRAIPRSADDRSLLFPLQQKSSSVNLLLVGSLCLRRRIQRPTILDPAA